MMGLLKHLTNKLLTDSLFKADRLRPLGLLIIFLIFVFPVLLIAALSYLRTKEDLSYSEQSKKQAIAYLTAMTVKEKLDRIVDVGLSLSTRVRFRQLVAAGDWSQAIEILADVPKDFSFIDRIFLSDRAGTLMADRPMLGRVVGTNFAYRDWYKGVSQNWKPYVSEVYQRSAEPKYNVIAVAVPIKGQGDSDIRGILVLQVRLDTFLEWTKTIEVGPSGFVYFVDRKGRVVAHPHFPPQGKIVDFLNVPVVQKVLRGERGIEVQVNPVEKEERIGAFEPVPGYGWGVIATQPTASAFAPQREALKRLVVIYGFIIFLSGSFAYLILHTMAERKRTEKQLEETNIELKKQSLRLEEANRLKSDFLANMSHELRTPLNGIIGFAEMMHDEKLGPVSAQHKEYLGDILSSAKHLLELINDVLDLTKVEAGKIELQPEPVELQNLIRETCDAVRTMAAKKRLKIETSVDPDVSSVVLDPGKLKQVLYNYLSNAIKFTDDGGQIIVRAAPEGTRDFRIAVEDTGIGIKPEDVGKLFVEFQQLDSTPAKKYQGTGLGLALTKKIVEAQGGRVGVASTPGKGSIFFAVIPRTQVTSLVEHVQSKAIQAATTAAATKRTDGSRTVLCIDDDPRSLKLTETALRNAGYTTVCETDAEAALALIEKDKPGAIILDLLMPGLDGFEFLERLHLRKNAQGIPIIVWTVMDLDQADRRRLRASVQAVLTKGRSGPAQLLQELGIHMGLAPDVAQRQNPAT